MRDEETVIQRKQLYKQVWFKPMSKLAKDYGISDVGLKKICKKLNVPTYVAITRARYQLFIPYVDKTPLIDKLLRSIKT